MNYVFGDNQEHNGYFDALSSDHDSGCLNIDDAIVNPLDNSHIKFDDIKLPTNEILDYEADNQDYYRSFDYENTPENVLNIDNGIEPISIFAENNSEVYSLLELNHGSSKDTNNACKNSKTKKMCNDSDEAVDPKVMTKVNISQTISDALPKESINQCKNIDKPLKKTKRTRSTKKESFTKFKRFRKFGYSRWGRKEDSQMFSVLIQLCNQESVDIEDFWTDHAKISIQHDCILIDLVSQMNWRGDIQSLLKRIQNLGKDQALSVRQMYTLKRLRKRANREKKEFSLEDVADSFPGKTISTLKSALEKILAELKH